MGSEDDAWAVLASVPEVGPATFRALLDRVGTARGVIDLAVADGGALALLAVAALDVTDGPADPRAPVVTLELAETIRAAALGEAALLDRLGALGVLVVTARDARYPPRLAATEHPPPVLFVQGDPAALAPDRAVAVVGTRRPTDAGRGIAARVTRALVTAGATVVSGLAVGIDGVAHAATIDSGGRTVAVLGGGHGAIQPRSHLRLAAAIVDGGGAVVSELAPHLGPMRWSFPKRNRIISGLSDATVVIEAPARSGALLTAAWALEQGRDCFLVPGTIDAPQSAGCLAFLREFPGSARVVSGVPQLIEDLGFVGGHRPARRGGGVATATIDGLTGTLGRTAARVAEAIVDGSATVDELCAVTDLPVAAVLATLAILERQGLVIGAFGRYRPAGSLAYVAPSGPRRLRRPGPGTARRDGADRVAMAGRP